jgi:hypothetical protein
MSLRLSGLRLLFAKSPEIHKLDILAHKLPK